MATSEFGLNIIKGFEGFNPKAYWDVKGHSVGYGSFGVPAGTTVTQEQATAMLQDAVSKNDAAIARNIKVPLNQNQHDALSSFTYNLGPGVLNNSTIAKRLNAGDYTGAADAMLMYNRAGGKINDGLVARRNKERSIFMGGAGVLDAPAPAVPVLAGGGAASEPTLSSKRGGDMFGSLVPPVTQQGGGLRDYISGVTTDPLFQLGISLIDSGYNGRSVGEGLRQGSEMIGKTKTQAEEKRRQSLAEQMQAQQFAQQQQQFQQQQQQQAAWSKIASGQQAIPGVPGQLMPVIQAMGPEAGARLISDMSSGQQSLDRQMALADRQSSNEQSRQIEVYRQKQQMDEANRQQMMQTLLASQGGGMSAPMSMAPMVPGMDRDRQGMAPPEPMQQAAPAAPQMDAQTRQRIQADVMINGGRNVPQILKGPAPPTGYRMAADGTSLERIPGGPADNKIGKATEFERKAVAYAGSMENAEKSVTSAMMKHNPSEAGYLLWPSASVLNNPDRQKYQQAVDEWSLNYLRATSGAAITKEDIASTGRTYFPAPGDTEDVKNQKKKARDIALEGIQQMGGRAIDPKGQKPPPPATAGSDPLGIR
jgi:lysozyme